MTPPGRTRRGGESKLHRDLKDVVAEAFRECGWKSGSEVRLPGGTRVDVLGERAGERWAVEIQLGEQRYSETVKRTLARVKQGVRVIWLFPRRFRLMADFPDLPAFTLARPGDRWHSSSGAAMAGEREDAERSEIVFGSRRLTVASWLRAFLDGQVRHCDEFAFLDPPETRALALANGRCGSCGREVLCLLVQGRRRARCGMTPEAFLERDTMDAVIALLRERGEPVDAVGRYRDDHLAWSGFCGRCRRRLGEGMHQSGPLELEPLGAIRRVSLPQRYELEVRRELDREVARHWCLEGEGGFCRDIPEEEREQERVAEALSGWVSERFEVTADEASSPRQLAAPVHRKLVIERAGRPPLHVHCLGGAMGSFVAPVQDHSARVAGAEAIWLVPCLDRAENLPQALRERVVPATVGSGGVELDERRLGRLLSGDPPSVPGGEGRVQPPEPKGGPQMNLFGEEGEAG